MKRTIIFVIFLGSVFLVNFFFFPQVIYRTSSSTLEKPSFLNINEILEDQNIPHRVKRDIYFRWEDVAKGNGRWIVVGHDDGLVIGSITNWESDANWSFFHLRVTSTNTNPRVIYNNETGFVVTYGSY